MLRTVIAKAAAVTTLALVALAGLAATTTQTAAHTQARPAVVVAPMADLIWG
ncbi:hypothetical protein [Kitasatospora sp. NPDC093806]|uniref:hypothetical protein n=1 Tax=Kitasatospora sp. NPDC093806 TaxID=3155075 RepID=UPI0034336544